MLSRLLLLVIELDLAYGWSRGGRVLPFSVMHSSRICLFDTIVYITLMLVSVLIWDLACTRIRPLVQRISALTSANISI